MKLTDARLAKMEPIIEKYRAQLFAQRGYEAHSIERELKDLFDISYQGVKPLMLGLAKHGRYVELAAWYMEHSNLGPDRVVVEFQDTLAKLYGIRWYHAADRAEKRAAYWEGVFGGDAQ